MGLDAPDDTRATYTVEEPDEPAFTIVEAVADVKGVDELDLQPLQHVIDTDALSELVEDGMELPRAGSDVSDEAAELRVRFEYEGCEVTVKRNAVHVQPS